MRVGLTAEMDPYERFLAYGEDWLGWDWKSYWLSAFARFKYDTFNDGYFPTKGVRLSLKGRYVFKGYTIDLDPEEHLIDEWAATTPGGKVPQYVTSMACAEAALPPELALEPDAEARRIVVVLPGDAAEGLVRLELGI